MKKIELSTPVEEMELDDLRTTFSEVLEAHNENIEQYSDLKESLESKDSEIEALQADLDTSKSYFADRAQEYTNLSAEMLADRFSLTELVELADASDEAEAEFSEEEVGAEAPVEGEEEGDEGAADEGVSLFADKPSKVPEFSEDDITARQEAVRSRLSHIGGLTLD
jgi:predicted nuclease with TOPRIM domain